jgi:lipoprotein LprG
MLMHPNASSRPARPHLTAVRRTVVAGLLALSLAGLAGCSDNKDGDGDGPKDDPVALLTDAKKTLDETSSVHVVINGRDIPDGASALEKADGVATHAPAFKGKLTVRAAGTGLDAEVVAVGGKVYAKLSFQPQFTEFKPSQLKDLGAPDPAVLLDPEKGITSILPTVKNPAIKGETRDGAKVLTEVTGAVEGKTLASIFPGAPTDQEFPSTFKIDKSTKQLVAAAITGPFYAGATSSYDVTLDRYGDQVEITKP